MEEDSNDLAVDGDRVITCLSYSSHKYNLSYGQVYAEIHMDITSHTVQLSERNCLVMIMICNTTDINKPLKS